MSNEIKYIEPTEEHVGQMVEVRDSEEQEWRRGELIAVINHEYGFVFKQAGYAWGHCCKYARIPRPLTYAERQAKCGLKVGDRVRFVRRFGDNENGYKLKWFDDLENFLGHTGKITSMGGEGHGLNENVLVDGMPYVLPYFVLEKVEDREPTTDDIGKTVYVVGLSQDKFTLDLVYCVLKYRGAIVRSGDKRFVHDLSNLRVIE